MARQRGPVLAIAPVCAAMAFTTGTATPAIIFGAPVDVTAGTDPREVAVADLSATGPRPRRANGDSDVCATLGDGEGAFTAAVDDVAGSGARRGARRVVGRLEPVRPSRADLNGDGTGTPWR